MSDLPDGMQKIVDVGYELLGSCQSADTIIQNVFADDSLTLAELPIELLHELDQITMECTVCNWWFEPHELDDDQICEDCK